MRLERQEPSPLPIEIQRLSSAEQFVTNRYTSNLQLLYVVTPPPGLAQPRVGFSMSGLNRFNRWAEVWWVG